jgi:putative SOS response-associated peptidase YedK
MPAVSWPGVPASGWYEWQKVDEKGKKKKRPYHFKPKAEPLALAGLELL